MPNGVLWLVAVGVDHRIGTRCIVDYAYSCFMGAYLLAMSSLQLRDSTTKNLNVYMDVQRMTRLQFLSFIFSRSASTFLLLVFFCLHYLITPFVNLFYFLRFLAIRGRRVCCALVSGMSAFGLPTLINTPFAYWIFSASQSDHII